MTLTDPERRHRAARVGGRVSDALFTPGDAHSSESDEGVAWEITDDVCIARRPRARSSSRTTPRTYDGHSREVYAGEVTVDRRTFDQHAHADTTFELSWPGIQVKVHSVMDIDITAAGYDVTISTVAQRDGEEISRRDWSEHIPR